MDARIRRALGAGSTSSTYEETGITPASTVCRGLDSHKHLLCRELAGFGCGCVLSIRSSTSRVTNSPSPTDARTLHRHSSSRIGQSPQRNRAHDGSGALHAVPSSATRAERSRSSIERGSNQRHACATRRFVRATIAFSADPRASPVSQVAADCRAHHPARRMPRARDLVRSRTAACGVRNRTYPNTMRGNTCCKRWVGTG